MAVRQGVVRRRRRTLILENAVLQTVTLDDKYTLESGRIFLNGTQALIRLLIIQHRRDVQAGLNTAGFVSGYRGSPLGSLDLNLWRAERFLKRENIHFNPGLNEDLAATSVWGTQQLHLFNGARYDGVFGMWYGKGPGVDRSMDVLKHGNMAGTTRHGGVLLVAGDDHGAKSSSLAHQSEQVFAAAMIPVLQPAGLHEYIDFGLLGFALSRFSGCWVAFKAVADAVDSTRSIDVDLHSPQIVLPQDFAMPPGGLGVRWPDPALDMERRLYGPKMQAVAAFARVNGLDRITHDSAHARLGIITTGKAYLDVLQALKALAIDESEAVALGLRIYKVGLSWPLEVSGARRFAANLQDVLVIEEKRGFLEEQLVQALYNLDAAQRPSVVGKACENGQPLLPSEGELSLTVIARAIVLRLERLGLSQPHFQQRLRELESREQAASQIQVNVRRTPFFCAGCPHNTSTRVPEGSHAIAGIGCHGMAYLAPERNTIAQSQMGGEGANWIGLQPFVAERHVFQNLGDGTYAHSGILPIRACVAARVNITFKILYNDAVAMTGGQPVEGSPSVAQIARQVAAEGVSRIVVVADDPNMHAGGGFPPGTTIRHRDDLDAVQRELRDVPGTTILLYDQTCAAEKRRRRKRKEFPDPPQRVFINEAVCEGCGDCSVESNCIAIVPTDTEFGRKRAIDQSSCNKDYSCVKGFCPSFVTVDAVKLRRRRVPVQQLAGLPNAPALAIEGSFGILVTGVGGTGVLTLGALIAMAAHLEGKGCSTLDFTGLAQKNGAVTSHIRITARANDYAPALLATGEADLLIACDVAVACASSSLAVLATHKTRAVTSTYVQPTAQFVVNPDLDLESERMQALIAAAVKPNEFFAVDSHALAVAAFGDTVAANLVMLGFAFQKGFVPLGAESIERAIELNGVAVQDNKNAFAWGRLAAHDPAAVERLMNGGQLPQSRAVQPVEQILERRAAFLEEYQDASYAQRYRSVIARIQAAERDKAAGKHGLVSACVENLFKLMAYKDEYEVARLYSRREFRESLERQFEGDFKLQFHLAPPVFAKRDPHSGRLQKRTFGGWMMVVLKVLARAKHLRGTRLDPFGYMNERKVERALIDEYERLLAEICTALSPQNHSLAVQLARVPERIRGYGHVKEKALGEARRHQEELLAQFRSATDAVTGESGRQSGRIDVARGAA